jgi:hypothetical protein
MVFASYGRQRAGCVIGRFGLRVDAGALLFPQVEEDDDAADAVEDMDASGELDFSKKKKKTKKKKDEKGKGPCNTSGPLHFTCHCIRLPWHAMNILWACYYI